MCDAVLAKSPRASRADSRLQVLLDAAARLFGVRGYSLARLTARATEVSRTRRFGVYRIEVTRGPQRDHVAMLSGTVYRMDKPIAALAASADVRSDSDAA